MDNCFRYGQATSIPELVSRPRTVKKDSERSRTSPPVHWTFSFSMNTSSRSNSMNESSVNLTLSSVREVRWDFDLLRRDARWISPFGWITSVCRVGRVNMLMRFCMQRLPLLVPRRGISIAWIISVVKWLKRICSWEAMDSEDIKWSLEIMDTWSSWTFGVRRRIWKDCDGGVSRMWRYNRPSIIVRFSLSSLRRRQSRRTTRFSVFGMIKVGTGWWV